MFGEIRRREASSSSFHFRSLTLSSSHPHCRTPSSSHPHSLSLPPIPTHSLFLPSPLTLSSSHPHSHTPSSSPHSHSLVLPSPLSLPRPPIPTLTPSSSHPALIPPPRILTRLPAFSSFPLLPLPSPVPHGTAVAGQPRGRASCGPHLLGWTATRAGGRRTSAVTVPLPPHLFPALSPPRLSLIPNSSPPPSLCPVPHGTAVAGQPRGRASGGPELSARHSSGWTATKVVALWNFPSLAVASTTHFSTSPPLSPPLMPPLPTFPPHQFRMAQQWLDSHEGGRVVDLSCGSGLFTRRFAAAGSWATVIAADLSGAMLEQTAAYIKEDKSLQEAQERIMLVQADVARLPFCSGSIDAIHAGAAMHCWPSPSLAMAEINRVLRPGGKFVASTILWPSAPFGNELFQSLHKSMRADTTMKLWEGEELRELLQLSGFVEYRQETNGQFIMVFGQKAE
ncbi:unnamed protein product [Closterium sp. Naga37s-1]|nr:unnamed protein product [Closterium sp. Naga37s-1]